MTTPKLYTSALSVTACGAGNKVEDGEVMAVTAMPGHSSACTYYLTVLVTRSVGACA